MSTILETAKAVTLHIPTPLRAYTDQKAEVVANGTTINEALADLTTQFPKLKPHLFNDAGALRAFVNIYLNDEDVRYLSRGATAVSPGDTLHIVPSIAGGVHG